MAVIQVSGMSVAQRLEELSLSLVPGTLVGLIGPNGAGKSSLLQALAGVLDYQGAITLDGEPLRKLRPADRARLIGLLPQQQQSAWALNVADIVALGRLPWGDRKREAIEEAIDRTGIRPLLDRRVDSLSGGQQARVWLARVLAGTPRVLLADEPLASLDIAYQRQIMMVLRDYAAEGRTVLVALHDLPLAARFCDRLLMLHEGRLIADGRPDQVLTRDHLRQVFSVDGHVDFSVQPPIISFY